MFDYTVTTQKDFSRAISDLKQALTDVRFGVMWELDVPAKLAEKGVGWDGRMRILEVCNPHHAREALDKDIRVGYFLPCKVVVYRDGGLTKVGIVRPSAMVDVLANPDLHDFALTVEKELAAALDQAAGQPGPSGPKRT